jgi:hypothetical protein
MTNEIFIELDRTFAPIPVDRDLTDEAFDHQNYVDGFGGVKWDQLLEKPRVVLLAEAGAGKTWEIRAAAAKLRASGKSAFFIRLELMTNGLDDAFDLGTASEFSNWHKGDEEAWFFLDSVDEARLINTKQFETAIIKFANSLGDSKQRSHVYITSRITEWRPSSELLPVSRTLS